MIDILTPFTLTGKTQFIMEMRRMAKKQQHDYRGDNNRWPSMNLQLCEKNHTTGGSSHLSTKYNYVLVQKTGSLIEI